jgi:hypothetical protein
MKVHIVDGVRRRNPLRRIDFRLTRQYWYPVVLAKKHLQASGLTVQFFGEISDRSLDCDVLILSSRQHDHLFGTGSDPVERARSVERLATRGRKLLWFDLRDSSGTPQFEVLPYVDLYVKQFVLRDMSLYERPLYGGRVFSDYYHKRFAVSDALERGSDDQEESFTLLDPRWTHKIVVGWDMSYDYRRHWVSVTDQVRNCLQECCRLVGNSPAALDFHPPGGRRDYDLSAMFSVGRYFRDSVAYQRRLALTKVKELPGNVFIGKVPRGEFVSTLRNSKIILSCFGNGEVCYREHEAWIAGAAVIMPDMSHLRTWPDRYRDGDTYKAIDWDVEGLPAAFEQLMADRALRERLAANGQATLRQMFSDAGLDAFASRFESLVNGREPDQPTCSSL